LAKLFAPFVETSIAAAGAPAGLAGIVVAAIFFLPPFMAALRPARRGPPPATLKSAPRHAGACLGLCVPTAGRGGNPRGRAGRAGLTPTRNLCGGCVRSWWPCSPRGRDDQICFWVLPPCSCWKLTFPPSWRRIFLPPAKGPPRHPFDPATPAEAGARTAI